MFSNQSYLSRRQLLQSIIATAIALNISPRILMAATKDKITRPIPSTNESLAIMGLGSSRTFNIKKNKIKDTQLVEVLQAFFEHGGQAIDSSPMYGNSEMVIGELLKSVTSKDNLFAATKVWADGKESGIKQMQKSMAYMGVKVMDLMQIHNLRDWQIHIKTLRDWKEQGIIRYIGITTSHGKHHEELERILKTEPLDFIQFSYNILDRTTDQRLLPLAGDKGIATMINRPFQRGSLFRKVKGKALPPWAAEFDCASWGQFFLKFIGSHPDVTCIIPATTKLKHMVDNMAAGFGRLPDPEIRKKMIH